MPGIVLKADRAAALSCSCEESAIQFCPLSKPIDRTWWQDYFSRFHKYWEIRIGYLKKLQRANFLREFMKSHKNTSAELHLIT